ncbi:hypothetical protein ACOMHN_058578 [Nucella lapillus]
MSFGNFGMMMVRLVRWKGGKRKHDGLSDVTIVVEDYSASAVGELSIRQGQQLEVVDPAPPVGPTQASTDWCLVRTMPPDGADPAQGLVPLGALKPIPLLRGPGARNSMELDESLAEGSTPVSPSSPVAKRRSSFRKWLTNPVRKLSGGKMDKQGVQLLEGGPRPAKGDKRALAALLVDKACLCPSGRKVLRGHLHTTNQGDISVIMAPVKVG